MAKNLIEKLADVTKKEEKEKLDLSNIYIRQAWTIRKAKKEDEKFLESNKTYRTECIEDGILFFDFDATDARPFFKDLLNRQGQFLEVKLLYGLLIFCMVFFLLFGIIFFRIPSQAYFDGKFANNNQSSNLANAIIPIWKDTTKEEAPVVHKNIRDVLLNNQ